MRKITAVLAALGIAAVGLTGCTASGADACPRPGASGSSATDLVTVTGDLGETPTVTMYTPLHTERTAAADVIVGEGTAITTDDQLVVLDLTIVSGETGETLIATEYDPDATTTFPLASLVQSIPGLSDGLRCATEGSRVVVTLAPEDIDPAIAENIGLSEGESAVAVVDLRTVYLAKADGADVFTSGFGLPAVVRAPDGTPGLVIPSGAPPAETVVQTLKRGGGAVVTGDVPVRVHYTGATWAEREVFDSTWGGEPASVTLEGVVPGFAEALEGQTVGSQVLVVIPPDQGYGDEGQGAIPGGATLVFVIDILGLDAPAAD